MITGRLAQRWGAATDPEVSMHHLGEGEPAFFVLFVAFVLLIVLAIGANFGWFGPSM